MKHLWAPWRMAYLKKLDQGPCFLCRFPRQKKNYKKNLIVKRGEHCFVILNRFPYNVGHLMVVPYAHKGDLEKMTTEETHELLSLTTEMKIRLDQIFQPHGYNLGINLGRAAGAGVPGHLHLHVVPRWSGDTNFMPVVGETKVLPLPLNKLYTALKAKQPVKKKRRKRR